MKVTKKEVKQQRSFFDSKVNVIIVCVAAAIILTLTAVFMIIESRYGKFQVNNNTDLKLEYVKAYFVDNEGPLNTGYTTESLDTGKSYTTANETVNLTGMEANLEVKFKFENHDELFTDSGVFNGKLEGNIKIEFESTADPNVVIMKVKAGNGIFKTRLIDCDEEYKVDLSQGLVLE